MFLCRVLVLLEAVVFKGLWASGFRAWVLGTWLPRALGQNLRALGFRVFKLWGCWTF